MPLGLATLVGALIAFRYGWIAVTITETDVINAVANRYVTNDGGEHARAGDCVGLSGQIAGAWITVQCGPKTYHVNQFGTVISTETTVARPSI